MKNLKIEMESDNPNEINVPIWKFIVLTRGLWLTQKDKTKKWS